jgi:hypothetical protein
MVKIQRGSSENIVHSRALGAEITVLDRGVVLNTGSRFSGTSKLSDTLKEARISWSTVLVHPGVS